MYRIVLNETSYYGAGCRSVIADEIRKRGFKKVLLVTDKDLIRFGVAAKIEEVLRGADIPYEIYSQIKANPTIRNVQQGVEAFKASGADCMVALGGGSSIDTAKAVGIIVNNPEFADVRSLEGVADTKHRAVPTFAVPTTAGTGSETTIAAVITDAATHHKYAIMDLNLVPLYAVMDPELTRDLPQKTTSTTGMDALTHAVEAYLCWTNNTAESIRLAEEAVIAIFKYLERAYNNGSDMEAREEMLKASFKAGFAFTRAGVGNVHAIAHTMGGIYGTPHGLANAVILPIVLEDYGEVVYKKLAHLAEISGVARTGSDEEKAKAFIAEIYAMNKRMGIPEGLHVEEKDIPQMVEWALAEANPTYPVPVLYDEARCAAVIRRINERA